MLAAIFLGVFLECTAALVLVEWKQPGEFSGAVHVVAELTRQSQEPVTMGMQRNLVKWYNLNLYSEVKDRDFPDRYWQILDFSNHAMGYLSVPSLGLRLPIYHGTDAQVLETGVGHFMGSAIPTGQPGEHTGLLCSLPLEPDTYFYIHILQQVLPYRVTNIGYSTGKEPDFAASEQSNQCTLVMEGHGKYRLAQAVLETDAPDEREITVESMEDSDGWTAAACLVLAMGILLVPLLMLCRTEA